MLHPDASLNLLSDLKIFAQRGFSDAMIPTPIRGVLDGFVAITNLSFVRSGPSGAALIHITWSC